jgi:hypothetical protein
VVNRDLRATDRLWIHDDVAALRVINRTDAKTVVGPNLFVMPSDIPRGVDLSGCQYVQPSDWAVNVWKDSGYVGPIVAWPVGIDTDQFRPRGESRRTRSPRALVYYKLRATDDLNAVLTALQARGVPFRLVVYGWYTEREYVEALAEADFVVWLGRQESQGIAFQEALACDVPALVCDATRFSQEVVGYPFEAAADRFHVTSVPYFDSRCGDRIETLGDFGNDLDRFLQRLGDFEPREYVLENLGLEKQAKEFVDLWQAYGMDCDDGINEPIRHSGAWSGLSRFDRLRFRAADRLHGMMEHDGGGS